MLRTKQIDFAYYAGYGQGHWEAKHGFARAQVAPFTLIDSAQHTVPFKVVRTGHIFTRIRVNGRPARAMIDLGDPNVLQLSTAFVQRQGMAVEKSGKSGSDIRGNEYELYQGRVEELQVSDCVLEDCVFLSGKGELEQVGRELRRRVDAVIGLGFFKGYHVLIDYKTGTIQLSQTAFPLGPSWSRAAFFPGAKHLILEVLLGNVPGRMVLDTGAPYNLLDKAFFDAHALPFTPVRKWHWLVLPMEFKRIETTIGDHRHSTDYFTYELERLHKLNSVGILGRPFFQGHLLYLPPSHRILYFRPHSS